MKNICDINNCTGCNLCAAVCPKHCINFKNLYNGHLYPEIDMNLCINCNKCVKVCIANNNPLLKKSAVYGCYAAWSKNSKEQYESASGGLATVISRYVLKQGGKVYGCAWNNDLEATHIGIETELELEKLRKSKYSLSKISTDLFEDIKKEVNSGRLCLFIGVACQCDAIIKYLGKKYNNLIIIDLLCRGGASPLIFKHHITYLCKKYALKDINNVTFRGGEYDCRLALRHNNKVLYYANQYEDEYFLAFMAHVIYRKSCFSCQYASQSRIGDITLADFWGLNYTLTNKYDLIKKGVNLLLINTEVGKLIFNEVKSELMIFERNIEEAIAGNETLKMPTTQPDSYEYFWSNMSKLSFEKAMRKTFKKEYNMIRKNKIKSIVIAPLIFIKHKLLNK